MSTFLSERASAFGDQPGTARKGLTARKKGLRRGGLLTLRRTLGQVWQREVAVQAGPSARERWAAARKKKKREGEWAADRRQTEGGESAKLRRLLRRSKEREERARAEAGMLAAELGVEECNSMTVQGRLWVAEAGLEVCRVQRVRDERSRPKRRREELGWRKMGCVVERGVQTTEVVLAAEAGQVEGRGVEMGTQTAMQPHSTQQPRQGQQLQGSRGRIYRDMHAMMDERRDAHRAGGVYPGGTGFY
jgi:hypothetical protein